MRAQFPYLIIGFLTVYVIFFAPALADIFIGDFLALLLSEAAVAGMQIMLFILFIYFMMIPVTETLREERTGQIEIILAAPIRPSDVLLGEFLGEVPFYSIFFTLIIGSFAPLLNAQGLTIFQIMITVAIFVITLVSSLWIGTVIAAVLRTRLGKTAKGRDIGRALAMIIALPLVALIYAIMSGGLFQTLADPGTGDLVRVVLSLLPSSWGAELIIDFASGADNATVMAYQTLTRFGGLIIFFIVTLWLGTKAANRAYSLEQPSFSASKAKPNGLFYMIVGLIGGGRSFSTILLSVFKDYSRRLENLSNLTYVIGLLFLMNIFIIPSVSVEPSGPPVPIIMTQFMLPILVVMVAGGVTTEGKENIFVYKKTPFGVARLVKARLVQSWLVVIPIAGVITAATTALNPSKTSVSVVTDVGLMILLIAASVAFALGLFLLNPPFSVKSVKLWLNVIIVQLVSIGLFIISMFSLVIVDVEPFGSFLQVQVLQVVLGWLVGIILLFVGKRKLNRLE
ncbi:MAG: ABC transporter permease [Candidatus Bathyarchaeota archaeon]|nr:MAG: ABC transporter permease [Candidatus Bathyarchaeota archaeon]